MKKLLSLIVAFALCVSMIPAAVAAESLPETGVYMTQESGIPTGSRLSPVDRGGFGPDGTVTLSGYWDIPYTPGEGAVIYYYNAAAVSLTVRNNENISVTQMGAGGQQSHCWRIRLSQDVHGDQWADLEFRMDEHSGGNFVITFAPSDPGNPGNPSDPGDPNAPVYERGLYYKPLRGVNDDNPHVDANDPFLNDPLVMSPYFDRLDLAFYFFDGADFIPVEVIFGNTLTVDPVCIDQRPGWYLFAAYDFCEGKIFYDDDITQTTYSLDVSTRLPDFAFYADEEVTEDNFRMYTIAEENTDVEFSAYKYKKLLTFLPADPNFSFGLGPGSDVELDIYCFQHQYLPNGNEVDEIPYSDFDYMWEASSNANGDFINLTLYTNDSDILCFLNGIRDGDWQFGAYANVLAPDDDSSLLFHANNQGNFASAKFLPQHLFDELAALNRSITIRSENFEGDVTLDDAVVDTIASATDPVSFCMTADAATDAEKEQISAALASGETTIDVVDLSLWFGSEPQHALGGVATVKYAADIAEGSSVKVYYLNAEGQLEEMDAKYQNGAVIFSSDHFSKFVLTEVGSSESPAPPRPPRPSSSDSSRPVKPKKTAAPDFTDVAEDYWAKDAIIWAAEQGYINGTSDSEYSPENNVSRQQIWMMLSRVSGKGAANMAAAKNWAIANGISDGTSPGAAVTRQQLVTLLYRYAVLMGHDVSVGEDTNILSYDDAFSVSAYAIPAFQWACGAGIVNGTTSSTLSPLGTATRAQFAVMLQRFYEKVL